MRMMYNIFINQKVLQTIGGGELDLIDGAILAFIMKMCQSKNSRLVRFSDNNKPDDIYVWVDYKNMRKELPLIKITSSSPIQKRVNKLIKYKLVKRYIHNYIKPCFCLTDKVRLLNCKLSDYELDSCWGCKEECESCPRYKNKIKSDE